MRREDTGAGGEASLCEMTLRIVVLHLHWEEVDALAEVRHLANAIVPLLGMSERAVLRVRHAMLSVLGHQFL